MRTFTVATFYDLEDRHPVRSRVRTYTLWYNPDWPGCVVYKVEADSPAAARRAAIDLRLEKEMQDWNTRVTQAREQDES